MEFVPFIALPFLINKMLDWVRSILPDKLEEKVIIPISIGLGILLTWAFAESDWGSEMMVGDKPFASINVVSIVIVGAVIGAGAGIVSDFKPNRLTPEQMERAVKQADTLVLEGAQPPAPIKKAASRTRSKA